MSGLSIKELLESSGVSARAIQRLERGRARRPRERTLRLLAEALEVEASGFFERA